MPFWFPFGPIAARPETMWTQRVLSELSRLHDAGAFSDVDFRRAWLMTNLVAVSDDPSLVHPELREDVVRWFLERSGLGEQAPEGLTADDVFGVIEQADAGVQGKPEKEPDVLHLLPGFAVAGRRWEFHLTDPDANRPAPHGHDIEDHSIVLNPYTGVVVDKNGKELKSAKLKELRQLWKDKTFRNFADRARQTMLEQQPLRPDAVPPLPTF